MRRRVRAERARANDLEGEQRTVHTKLTVPAEELARRLDSIEVNLDSRVRLDPERLRIIKQHPARAVVALIEPFHDVNFAEGQTVIHAGLHCDAINEERFGAPGSSAIRAVSPNSLRRLSRNGTARSYAMFRWSSSGACQPTGDGASEPRWQRHFCSSRGRQATDACAWIQHRNLRLRFDLRRLAGCRIIGGAWKFGVKYRPITVSLKKSEYGFESRPRTR